MTTSNDRLNELFGRLDQKEADRRAAFTEAQRQRAEEERKGLAAIEACARFQHIIPKVLETLNAGLMPRGIKIEHANVPSDSGMLALHNFRATIRGSVHNELLILKISPTGELSASRSNYAMLSYVTPADVSGLGEADLQNLLIDYVENVAGLSTMSQRGS